MKRFYCSNLKGFSFFEMIITLALTLTILAAGGSLFTSGNKTWNTGDSHVKMQESLRYVLERLASEIRLSNFTAGQGALQIIDGAGLGTTDAIKFSVPVICEVNALLMENDAVAHWGAPLNWGCKDSTCMDADNDCDTVDYKYIYYVLNADGRLERSVLDDSSVPVATEEMGVVLSDLQFSSNGATVTINAAVEEETQQGRVLTAQTSLDVYLRN